EVVRPWRYATCRKSLARLDQLREVRRKLLRSCPAAFLIDLRPRPASMRPGKWQLQGDDLQELLSPARARRWWRRRRTLAHDSSKGVREMADHLRRCHAAPPPRRVGTHALQSCQDHGSVVRVAQ